MTGRRSVYHLKNECMSPEEGVYITGRKSYITGKKTVYDWKKECNIIRRRSVYHQNNVFISLEKGVYKTGKTTVYYWKKGICFKINYSTIQTRSFHFSFK